MNITGRDCSKITSSHTEKLICKNLSGCPVYQVHLSSCSPYAVCTVLPHNFILGCILAFLNIHIYRLRYFKIQIKYFR